MKKIVLAVIATFLLAMSVEAQTTMQGDSVYMVPVKKSELRYQGEVNLAYVVTPFSALFETVHGVRINKYLFAGAGLGLQYSPVIHPNIDYIDRAVAVGIPVFANVKGYYPVTEKIAPFINLSLGGALALAGAYPKNGDEMISLFGGFYCDFGAGIKLGVFTIGLGLINNNYEFNGGKEMLSRTSFYAKIGFQW